VFHVLNAWDDGGRVVIDVMQFDEPPLFPRADGSMPAAEPQARLVRWVLDPDAGTDAFSRTALDDTTGEFPRIDDRRAGLRHRFACFAGDSPRGDTLDSVVALDLIAGRRSAYRVPAGDAVSEPVFAPRREDAAEGDGWLLAVAWRAAEQCSHLLVLEAQDVARGPIASVRLPQRVPFGFHGNWMPTEEKV